MPGAAAAERSAGCGRPPPDRPPQSLEVAGRPRTLSIAIPEGYMPDRAYRLVVAFHGRTTPAGQARRYYGLEAVDSGGTIFVYPQALRQRDGTFTWRVPEDLAFFDSIVDRLASRYCIAMDHIFAVGHSLGASFANSLACARGSVLRGVATVAGGEIGGADAATCSGRVAALLLHNPEDRLVPIAAGRAALAALLAQNGLPAEPAARYAAPFACDRFGAREARNPVVWCLSHQNETDRGRYYPHQWPDGAARTIMTFFAALE